MGVAGIQSSWRRGPLPPELVPLCSSEGSQRAGLRGRVPLGWCLRTRRVDPEEQELGPLRMEVKRGALGCWQKEDTGPNCHVWHVGLLLWRY